MDLFPKADTYPTRFLCIPHERWKDHYPNSDLEEEGFEAAWNANWKFHCQTTESMVFTKR